MDNMIFIVPFHGVADVLLRREASEVEPRERLACREEDRLEHAVARGAQLADRLAVGAVPKAALGVLVLLLAGFEEGSYRDWSVTGHGGRVDGCA